MRRLAGWALLFLGAFFVLVGIVDTAIGPDLEQVETGARNPRWYGLIHIVVGAALAYFGHRLTKVPENR